MANLSGIAHADNETSIEVVYVIVMVRVVAKCRTSDNATDTIVRLTQLGLCIDMAMSCLNQVYLCVKLFAELTNAMKRNKSSFSLPNFPAFVLFTASSKTGNIQVVRYVALAHGLKTC